MMELPFELIKFLEFIDQHPYAVLGFAAFHPLLLIILFLPLWILKKIGIYVPKENNGLVNSLSLGIITSFGWIIGFLSQFLLLNLDVSGIKMLLIYLSMYLCIIPYVLINIKRLSKLFSLGIYKRP